MRPDELELACALLARLVRDEYPEGLSLVEIAETWSSASDDELAALRALDAAIASREEQSS